MRDAVWVLVPLGAFASVTWVIHVIVDGFRRRQQLRISTEFHTKLLDRIGSATEFGEFLNSPGGAKFLDSLTLEKESGGGAHVRILRALQTGLVFLALGLGVFILVGARTLRADTEEAMATIATICTSLGVGLLLSAMASYGLSQRLGLLNDERQRRIADSVRSV
jgi:hypothetical protein